MEITQEEQQLLAEFRRMSPHQRQELLAVAKGLVSVTQQPEIPAPKGQCALNRPVAGGAKGDDPVFTE
jgi:hypothetical protein